MKLEEQLRYQRKQLHLSQESLAQELHVTRQTISNWENGKSLPDIYSLIAISNIFGVSLDDLIKGDTAMQKHLDVEHEITPWFLSGTIFCSFYTVLNNGPLGSALDPRLRMMLVIGQLLFSIFLLCKGRRYSHSFIEHKTDGTKVIGDRFAAWLMYYAVALQCILTVIFGALTISD
ncbi:helix-turn-helix transcriptional regulator [Lacticaseibacillus jixianensis]|uniref:Helix-turn-helix transcriptional regulator n=1 Tax=Lacticaseibacillus jixianensis TaxID=2486012 RepID=A0ABW4B8A6_9LACO|nr:helix-turn-helix transcriptional regulator [Lacticaseibacillus jixianensis]